MSYLIDLTSGNEFIYSYYNKKVGAYQHPIFSAIPKDAIGETIRRTCILQANECKAAHIDECDVYLMGSWNDVTGKFAMLEKPEFILACDQFFVKEEKEDGK